jgi:hypothetical protein
MSYLRQYIDENQKLENILFQYLNQSKENNSARNSTADARNSIEDERSNTLMLEIEKRKQNLN